MEDELKLYFQKFYPSVLIHMMSRLVENKTRRHQIFSVPHLGPLLLALPVNRGPPLCQNPSPPAHLLATAPRAG